MHSVTLHEDRLTSFLADWRASLAADSLEQRLTRLLKALSLESPIQKSPTMTGADSVRLSALLPQLAAVLGQSSSTLGSINPWTVSGLQRREVRVAGVLASLWTKSQMGSVAQAFLLEFFRRLDVEPGSSLPDGPELSEGYRVRTEHCPGPDQSDRVDLVIETVRHLIAIEVKIGAPEGPDQFGRYIRTIERNARSLRKEARVVLLAPFRPAQPPAKLITAKWSTVRAAAIATLPRRQSEYEFTHFLLAHFAHHIRSF